MAKTAPFDPVNTPSRSVPDRARGAWSTASAGSHAEEVVECL